MIKLTIIVNHNEWILYQKSPIIWLLIFLIGIPGEIKRGYFEPVFEVPIKKMGIIERLLQYVCELN